MKRTNTRVRRKAIAPSKANQPSTKAPRATARNGYTAKTPARESRVAPPVTLLLYSHKTEATIGTLELSAAFYGRLVTAARWVGLSVEEFIQEAVSSACEAAYSWKDGAR